MASVSSLIVFFSSIMTGDRSFFALLISIIISTIICVVKLPIVGITGIVFLLASIYISSSIKNADRIVVIENGELIEEGKHEDLLSKNGRYVELYRLQYK